MTSIARNGFATVLALALIGGPILLAPAQILAQEKHKLSWSVRPENTQYTVQHGLDIADTPGHVIRLAEVRRTWPENAPMVEGLKVVEEVVRPGPIDEQDVGMTGQRRGERLEPRGGAGELNAWSGLSAYRRRAHSGERLRDVCGSEQRRRRSWHR